MAQKRAKTLTPEQLDMLLADIEENSTMPIRDRLIALLSFKAGLRVAEITKIKVSHMTDAEGKIGKTINIFSNVAKGGKAERQIPMHPEIKKALADFMKAYPGVQTIAISSQPFRWRARIVPGMKCPKDVRIRPMQVNALTQYVSRMFDRFGLPEATSHSGRRTFGTTLARSCNRFHNSLKDVQILLGHRRLETTESYLEPSDDVSAMVAAL